jgi:hypothetical protein
MPSNRALHLLDAAMVLWVAAWIGLGVAIGINVEHLTDLSHTVAADGSAVQTLGKSLSGLQSVPFVGGSIGHAAAQIRHAGASAVASGHSSASAIHALGVLLAVAVALLPSVPVFGFYLPLRINRRREAQALRRALQQYGGDPRFEAFLAQRAAASLGYRRLSAIPGAWADVEDGRNDRLAAAELRRLGIDGRSAKPRAWGRS